MESVIIQNAKSFVGAVRNSLTMIEHDNLFIVAVQGDERGASSISVALYDDVKVGSIAREKYPSLFEKADTFIKLVKSQYSRVSGVVIMITDEFETDVFVDGKVLRICNLDA